MKKIIKNLSVLIMVLFIHSALLAGKTDSLIKTLNRMRSDTHKVVVLKTIAWNLLESYPDSAKIYLQQGYALSDSLHYPYGKTLIKYIEASLLKRKGKYDSSLVLFKDNIRILDSIGRRKDIGSNYLMMGNSYMFLSQLEKSLNAYLDARKIFEELKLPSSSSRAEVNIGIIQNEMGNYKDALKAFTNALQYFEKVKNANALGDVYSNMASTYTNMKKVEKAVDFHLKALSIRRKMKDHYGILVSTNGIGTIYEEREQYEKALEYYREAEKGAREMNFSNGLAVVLNNIGSVYFKLGDNQQALHYVNEALSIAESINQKKQIQFSYKKLSEIHASGNDYKNALHYHELYTAVKDSILNKETTRQVAEMEAKYENEKKQKEIELLNEKQAKNEALISQQKTRQNALIAGVGFFILLALLSYRNYRNKQKTNVELAGKNKVIEEKNRNITDSINYAKKIQDAIFVSQESLDGVFNDHFIINKPKDVISGDFYWIYEPDNDQVIWAACDCTGHGVPGALMSMIGNTLLNEIIIEKQIHEPSAILDQLRDNLIKSLRQHGAEGDSKDGMDMALCVLNKKTGKLQYAGANNPLYILTGDGRPVTEARQKHQSLYELRATKQPIGYIPSPKPFESHTIQLQKGDSIYIFSDGYADQFGGPKGKKFKYKPFKELLVSVSEKPMKEQKEVLDETFENWKGDLEQVDDVCVIGVRI